MKRLTKLTTSAVLAISSAVPAIALAEGSPFERSQQYTDSIAAGAGVSTGGPDALPQIIGNIINIALGFMGIILLCIILWAGFLWMTAGGDSKKTETATALIKNAVIGLIIIVAAFAISNFVMTQIIQRIATGA
jgi:predicted permease